MTWPLYFPFRTGEALLIEAKLSLLPPVRATACVREVTDQKLVLDYSIPPISIWFKTYPGAQGSLTVVQQESSERHSVSVSVDGKVHSTDALRTVSDPKEAERRFFVPTKEAGRDASFTLRKVGEDKIEIGEFDELPKLAAGLTISFSRR